MNKILIIDDEPDILELLTITLTRMGVDIVPAATVAEARAALDRERFQLCLTDMRLPDGDGMEIIQYIQENQAGLPVAMITAHGDTESAITALKLGAFDFLNKPLDLDRLRQLVINALKVPETPARAGASKLLGDAPSIALLRKQIGKVARNQAPVYISGESGSGKEVVARLIHSDSNRSNGPFIPVNCGAVPTELMESEFFGHTKGSFTGATDNKTGLFEAANGGTLFLDEIADLPLSMQVKLLRAIQEKKVRPVGSNQEVDIDVRVLSATHKDLSAEVEAGHFRNDLYYRINVIELKVPALRERLEDLDVLANSILESLSLQYESPKICISEAAIEHLRQYHFPGNVRELENILERASTLCDDNTIEAEDLSITLDTGAGSGAVYGPSQEGIDSEAIRNLDDYLENIERKILLDTMERARWNKTTAAKMLGISFRSIRYRLNKLNIE